MSQVIVVRTKTQKELVKDLPGILSGKKVDRFRLFQVFWSAVARSMLRSVYDAYEVKSEGGVDELGNKWKPLSPRTIAARPIRPIDRKEFGIGRTGNRGLLSPRENARWKGIFASTFARNATKLGEREAAQLASKTAWGILKSQGARLRSEVLSSRNVLILRLTNRLFRSLEPTQHRGVYRPRTDQIAEASPKSIKIGTLVPYAADVARARPIFPPSMQVWIDRAIQDGLNAVLELIGKL